MDYEAKKQELARRAQVQKDQLINMLVNEVLSFLQQQKEIQDDLNELEAEKKPAKK
jgi:hypothetical protein